MALRPIAWSALALLAAAVAALGAGAWWLVGTEPGLRWALQQLEPASGGDLRLDEARGSIAGGMRFERIAFASGALRIDAREVSGRLAVLSLFTGTLRIEALQARSVEVVPRGEDAGEPPPQRLALPFRVRIYDAQLATLRLVLRQATYEATAVRFSYSGGPLEHALRDASAETPWGRLSLAATMAAASPFRAEARASLERHGAKASAFARLLPFAENRIEALQARVEGLDLARFHESLPHTLLKGHFEGAGTTASPLAGKVSLTNGAAGAIDQRRIPASALAAQVEVQGDRLLLRGLDASAAGGQVRGSGSIAADRAQLQLRLAGIDLRALRTSLRRTKLSGEIALSLAPAQQSARGALSQRDMKLAFDASRAGNAVQVRSFRAEAAGGVATGAAELDLGGAMRGSASLRFSGFDPARFGDYPEGSLNGRAEVSGTLAEPRRVRARWSVAQSRLHGKPLATEGSASIAGARVFDLDAEGKWGENRFSARGAFGAAGDELAWTLAADRLPIEGLGAVRAKGTARGALAEHEVVLSARAEHFAVGATLRGGWLGQAGWKGELARLRVDGKYPLVLEAPAALQLSAEKVHAGVILARLGEGRLHVRALDWTPGRLATRGEFSGFPAAWLLYPAGLGKTLGSTLLLDGNWALDSTPQLDGRLQVRRASGDLAVLQPAPLQLGLGDATLAAQFEKGAASLTLQAASRLGALRAQGTAASLSRDAAIQFEAQAELADIRAIAGTLPANVRIGGRAAAVLQGRGTLGAPEVAGRVSADSLSVHYPPYGIYLDGGRLRASLEGEALRVEELTLRGGDGAFSARGVLPLTRSADATLRWTASDLRLLGRPDLRLVVSGEGSAAMENRRVALQGRVRVNEGYIEQGLHRLPRLDDDIVIVGREGNDAPPNRTRPPLDVDLLVDLGERLKVRAADFDGRLQGEVHLASTGGSALRAFGRIYAADATYRAYGRNLQVDPGVVIFNGPLDNPALQISAWRRNQEVQAGVRITGNLREPRVELVSEPPLPEGAKLSWLVLGRAPTEMSGGDLALLQTAASALLGRGNAVPFTTRIADAVGLDELALRGSSELANRVVAFGKRLNDRLYITYEQGIGTAAQNLVKIDLSLTERISLRAQTGTSSGAGVYYRYSWD